MNTVKGWLKAEPVRAHAYAIGTVVVLYLVAKGYVDLETSDMILTVAGLALGKVATESVRSHVSSVHTA